QVPMSVTPPPGALETPASVRQSAPAVPEDYEILGELGRGGMGVVYKAWQKSLKRLVALKMIREDRCSSPNSVERFYQEARAAAGLRHPNIVPIYEVGQLEGRPYFTLALVNGQNLSDWVKTYGLPLAERAADVVRQVAGGVAHAHQ